MVIATGISSTQLDVGDRVRVQLISVDVKRGFIDFKKVGPSRR
jgi:translation initiation factor IF-1